jgi:hypothetical protein
MHDVKRSQEILRCINVMDERAAHVIDFVDKVGVQRERAAVVMHAMNKLIMRLAGTCAGEYVNVVSLPLQSRAQLRNVGGHSSHGNRMQGFPG